MTIVNIFPIQCQVLRQVIIPPQQYTLSYSKNHAVYQLFMDPIEEKMPRLF